MKNPIQPLFNGNDGRLRFKENQIVSQLLDFAKARGFGLNEIAAMNFTDDDRQQFAQLIGYSLDGYGTLSYVSDEALEVATTGKDDEITHA